MAGQVYRVDEQVPNVQPPKPDKPIFKRPVFWVVIVVFVLLVGGCSSRCAGRQAADTASHEGMLQTPLSHSETISANYEDIAARFEKAGFTNVNTQALGDMVTGLLMDEGDVDEVSIDGETTFDKGDWYAQDAKIAIRYHSYPSKEEDSSGSKSSSSAKTDDETSSSEAEQTKEEQAEKRKVPDTVGMTYDKALEALEEAGFEDVDAVEADGSSPWIIIESNWIVGEQNPAAGKKARTSDTITLTVAKDSSDDTQASKKSSSTKKKAKKAVPTEYTNALYQAQSYSDNLYMSKKGIYDQLTSEYGEGFGKKAAKYAVNHVKANWNKNALKKAKSYQKEMHMSKSAIYEQLISSYGEQFTEKQARWAVNHL